MEAQRLQSAEFLLGQDEPEVLTVSELTRMIKSLLDEGIPYLWITGEVSNFTRHSSGHIYFVLKDEESQIPAVAWSRMWSTVKFEVENGMKVEVFGRVSVYPPRGKYQFYVEKIRPKGIGPLQFAFEQLKRRLAQEGLFDKRHKKPLPLLPRTIAIVTSPTGAAIRDMVNIIHRRFPNVRIVVYPVKVQGEGAAEEIARAIHDLNTLEGIDVMIVGRGGGSIEDLWAFNEEIVARAIFASKIPIISAVGHEIDVTISDFVADRRALTPSEAAEIVVPLKSELTDKLRSLLNALTVAIGNIIQIHRTRLRALSRSYAFRHPLDRISQHRQRLEELSDRLHSAILSHIKLLRERAFTIAAQLEALSPLAVLSRGYSITKKLPEGSFVIDASRLRKGDILETRFAKGMARSRVEEVLS